MPVLATGRHRAPAQGPSMLTYSIGDVHGRSDLLRMAQQAVVTQAAGRPARLIYHGDYIDRGPDSAGVLDQVDAGCGAANVEEVALEGNHEQFILKLLFGRNLKEVAGLTYPWLRSGGRAALQSFGLDPDQFGTGEAADDPEGYRRALAAAIGERRLALLQRLRPCLRDNDYLFVHAGIDPGATLAAQIALAQDVDAWPHQDERENPLLWMRTQFLGHEGAWPDGIKMVVHGHTPEKTLAVHRTAQGNGRICVDHGAYASDRLTILELDPTLDPTCCQMRFLVAAAEPEPIAEVAP